MKHTVLLTAALSLACLAYPTFADSFDGTVAFSKKDYGAAFREYKASAEKGDASGQVGLGNLYLQGLGVPQDSLAAAKWYEKASAQGNFLAQFQLAKMYLAGDGITKDRARAAGTNGEVSQSGLLSRHVLDGADV